ncbi:uncharacterized protein LOC128509698 [Clarias gariepinus]|uniref:uncharacterized protein LOC128509698 n=1 Tax=Clarias gariepinus TaxID=13013 RepID=UPI00234DA663|nr:uncharacterized protein LOC128509698 [Clarias gariepinus]
MRKQGNKSQTFRIRAAAELQISYRSQQSQKHKTTVMEERKPLLQKLQQNVDEVRVIMHNNVIMTEARGENLDELDQRADRLLSCSRLFARTVRNPTEKQDQNPLIGKIICAVILTATIITLTIVIIGSRKHWF